MIRLVLLTILIFSVNTHIFAQLCEIRGRVIGGKEKKAVEYATISLPDNDLWVVTNDKGLFILRNVPAGKTTLTAYSLGYVKTEYSIDVKAGMDELTLILPENNLSLDEVVITAQQKSSAMTTGYVIEKTSLEHAQLLDITDIMSLLPGGKTNTSLNLATDDSRFSLRSGSVEKGNAAFGTAVEMDGVRLQNNSSPEETNGIDSRHINPLNIESVEVITGIPSVEYGDLSNGLVKLNTRKGKSPFIIELSTKPHTKQSAFSKGFDLGKGILNTSLEHTRSVSNLVSPYYSYSRNSLALNYGVNLNKATQSPMILTVGVSGNIGGSNSKADPDAFLDTYSKARDNALRAYATFKWSLNKPWITNVELSGAAGYTDKLQTINENKSSSASQAAIHTTQEGYFIASPYDEQNPDAPIILLAPGYWYLLSYLDSKPVDYSAKMKADWTRKFASVTNKLLVGGEFNRNGNEGKGIYYDDMRYAPTWRERKYSDDPYMNNFALYAEDKISISLSSSRLLEFQGGLRSDITHIRQSEYGTAANLSPRFNAKYTFLRHNSGTISDVAVYAGWGKTVKLPSFEVLYPSPSYQDKLAFAPGTLADGSTFYAYYTYPDKPQYNPALKWQSSRQWEIGVEANLKWVKVSLSAFSKKTYDPYMRVNTYVPYTYKLTEQEALNNCPIPSQNRIYSIDQNTGVVTVTDKTGAQESVQLSYTERNTFKSIPTFTNGSPVERKGLEWIVDFAQIPALRTSFRLDGNYYYYRGVDETLIAGMPNSSYTMADGRPYQYVGYYIGSNSTSTATSAAMSSNNGSLSKQLNTNLTITAHIPKIRLILSMKIEAAFYNYKRYLSEYSGGNRGIVIDSPENYTGSNTDIYNGDNYVAVYPLYYSTWDDPDTKIPFAEKFIWAKDNDPALYNELVKLVVKTTRDYYFRPNKISSYYSANLSVTKEIGNKASLSFFATNFINNMALVKSSWDGTSSTLYNSGYIPQFYYGLSLRLKL